MNEFNFAREPGMKKYNNRDYVEKEPLISVIVPYYNSEKYIEQTITSILNQTFPYYEILIIDDGSTEQKSLDKLEEIQKLDKRIKVFHKKNEGLATTRDFGSGKSAETCKYLMFLDDDDLIEPTFLECAYWTLETNKEASWAYSDSVGFGTMQYTWNKYFNSEKLKKENELISEALVRKSDFYLVNGYDLKEKAVNEDWNFWLKLMAKGKFPVHMSFYGQWYRRKETGELQRATDNRKKSLEIINQTANQITKEVKAIQYPNYQYQYDLIPDTIEGMVVPELKKKEDKINLLFIVPWLITGGADLFNLQLVKKLNQEKYTITVITTETNQNVLRQYFEENENTKVYDLTSFLDHKYWIAFINYIIQKEKINVIMNSNSKFGYSILAYLKGKYPQIPIIDYVHMEEWYNRNGGYSRYSAMYGSVLDKTLVCNENSRKILIHHFGRKQDEVKTVYIGVDEKKFNPDNYDEKELKQKYLGGQTNKKIISFICRISEQKRPMLLLKIVEQLKKTRQDFKVLVVGDGNLLGRMKEETKKLGLAEDIIFLGKIQNTAEIYKISDVTINCSLKEGLALTAYESLSMNVPVVSSDVGGQKELITEDVGAIIELRQDEKEIYLEEYKEQEINSYVEAIDKILNNLNTYKQNCRKRICEHFTIDKMIENMGQILEDVKQNPNPEKIRNGQGLATNLEISKELITANLKSDEVEYAWECMEYEKKVYGRAFSAKGMNYKKELLKEKLWNIPMWRTAIKVYHKLRG
ncbi:MAG: glycosyltransferase [Clostridia bacterium]|nr:glycosyltransferase [Clostridia bacterium]